MLEVKTGRSIYNANHCDASSSSAEWRAADRPIAVVDGDLPAMTADELASKARALEADARQSVARLMERIAENAQESVFLQGELERALDLQRRLRDASVSEPVL